MRTTTPALVIVIVIVAWIAIASALSTPTIACNNPTFAHPNVVFEPAGVRAKSRTKPEVLQRLEGWGYTWPNDVSLPRSDDLA